MTDIARTSSPALANGGAVPVERSRDPGFWALTLGSIGVVYGDIGTSPLYAFREAVTAAVGTGGAPTREIVLGVVSLILWVLFLIVSLKYVLILLRADNRGEGGTLSLMALAYQALGRVPVVLMLGILGAALFYGDSLITPAISVLSAVEGLKLVEPEVDPYVIPLTVVILVLLFLLQARGTAKVATFFGPVMVLWFAVIGLSGLLWVVKEPAILAAFNPKHALLFVGSHGILGLTALGAVFLAVTGAEALYADLGHFGRKPIQVAWLALVMPTLALNYLGQGALVLSDPKAIENPFYLLVPAGASLVALVVLATIATVIASQAVITGAYSLTQQAIQLGLLPRLVIRHTSETLVGQIYMPRVNAMLLVGVLLLVFLFRSSSALASAYGIAVTGTMVVTSIMAFVVIWRVWHWPIWVAALLMVPFLLIELMFLGANLLKIVEGGWLPLLLGLAMVTVITTWRRGTHILAQKTRKTEIPLAMLMQNLEKKPPHTVPGTAVFLTADPEFAPTALLHNLKHNKVLHEHNVFLTVATGDTPRVPEEDRVRINHVTPRFTRVMLRFGFMETPNIPKALAIARKLGWTFDIMSTSFFLSRRSIKPAANSGMPLWQDRLFIALARSASDATDFFQIPTGRVVEVGTQVTV